MKQRLKAIIDACTEQNSDSATILKMLKSMRDEWKEPRKVVGVGYLPRNYDFKNADTTSIKIACWDERGDENSWMPEEWPPFEVEMIIRDCDE